MDEESGSTEEFYVLLDCCFLCLVFISCEASVQKSVSVSHSPECEEFKCWPVNVEEHGTD